MFKNKDLVKVYDGDLVEFTLGKLVKEYTKDRWLIETIDGSKLIRYIKIGEAKKDGCGYVLKRLEEIFFLLLDDTEQELELLNNFITGLNLEFRDDEIIKFKLEQIEYNSLFANGEFPPEICFFS